MKRTTFIAVISMFLMAPNAFAQHGDFDLFPLAPGVKYSYQYYSYESDYVVNFLESESIDSGRVEYFVHDYAQLGDSVLIWSITQSENLWHFRFGLAGDTTYRSINDTDIVLIERLSGQHELVCSSWVWQFPTTNPMNTIYRYSDFSPLAIVYNFPSPALGIDSLSFTALGGFRYRRRHREIHGISHFYSTLLIEQEGMPTAVNDIPKVSRNVNSCQNFPNPFNASTTIVYSMKLDASIDLRVFDILGRQVMVLDLGYQHAGQHSHVLEFQGLPSGIYLYQMHTKGTLITGKFLLAK